MSTVLAEYRELGARFAKWRATILIGDGTPTDFAVLANAHAMARYAALVGVTDRKLEIKELFAESVSADEVV